MPSTSACGFAEATFAFGFCLFISPFSSGSTKGSRGRETQTLWVPTTAPLLPVLKTVKLYLPLSSVSPMLTPVSVAASGTNDTTRPGTGCPLRVTAPDTGTTFSDPPHPELLRNHMARSNARENGREMFRCIRMAELLRGGGMKRRSPPEGRTSRMSRNSQRLPIRSGYSTGLGDAHC